MKYYKILKDTEVESFIIFHYSIGELCYLNENDKQTKELLENGNIGEIEEEELLNKLSENQENWNYRKPSLLYNKKRINK